MRDIHVPHQRQPLAVQIRSRRICLSLVASKQLEIFWVYNENNKGGFPWTARSEPLFIIVINITPSLSCE
ncbi:hypothetical protein FMK55_26975 [Klebsiella michiganensis]|nr:hypothetical protein [Klebsiella michiganensis]